jgi:hypothetical protein
MDPNHPAQQGLGMVAKDVFEFFILLRRSNQVQMALRWMGSFLCLVELRVEPKEKSGEALQSRGRGSGK